MERFDEARSLFNLTEVAIDNFDQHLPDGAKEKLKSEMESRKLTLPEQILRKFQAIEWGDEISVSNHIELVDVPKLLNLGCLSILTGKVAEGRKNLELAFLQMVPYIVSLVPRVRCACI